MAKEDKLDNTGSEIADCASESLPIPENEQEFELKFNLKSDVGYSAYDHLRRLAPESFPKMDLIDNPDGTVTLILIARINSRNMSDALKFLILAYRRLNPFYKKEDGEEGKKKAPDLDLDRILGVFDTRPNSVTREKPPKSSNPSKIAA